MARLSAALLVTAAASACQTPQYADLRERAAAEGTCDDAPAQYLVGRKATSALAAEALAATGARVFEWIPPDVIVTLAFNRWRLRVTYDDDMRVREIRCG